MLSDQKFYDLWNENPECLANDAGVLKLGRAIEQAVIAEQAAPAGEAVPSNRFVYRANHPHGTNVIDQNSGRWMSVDLVREMASVLPPAECRRCSELAQDLQTTADVLAEYVESHRNIELEHANQYEILCRRTDEVIKSEQAWQQLDDDRVEYINDVGDILGQNDTDESLLNAAKRVMATIEFQKKAWEADFIRMTRMEAAIERMRVAGGKDEFWNAFELAKDLL